jgi:hypothetical protein
MLVIQPVAPVGHNPALTKTLTLTRDSGQYHFKALCYSYFTENMAIHVQVSVQHSLTLSLIISEIPSPGDNNFNLIAIVDSWESILSGGCKILDTLNEWRNL